MDNESKGVGNIIDYKFRMHDVRIGRFFSVDPLKSKYPFYTPYAFSGNRVVDAFELEGLEPVTHTVFDGDTEASISKQYGVSVDQLRELNSGADYSVMSEINIANPNQWQYPDQLQGWINAGAEVKPGDLGQHPALLGESSEEAFDIIYFLQVPYNPGDLNNYSSFGLSAKTGSIPNGGSLPPITMPLGDFHIVNGICAQIGDASIQSIWGLFTFGGGTVNSLRPILTKAFFTAAATDIIEQGVVLTMNGRDLGQIDMYNGLVSGLPMPSVGKDFLKSIYFYRLNGLHGYNTLESALLDFGQRRAYGQFDAYFKSGYSKIIWGLGKKFVRGNLNRHLTKDGHFNLK